MCGVCVQNTVQTSDRPALGEEIRGSASARGQVPLGVCSTSSEQAVTNLVRVLMGPERFSRIQIFAGDVVQNKKPKPDIYLLARDAASSRGRRETTTTQRVEHPRGAFSLERRVLCEERLSVVPRGSGARARAGRQDDGSRGREVRRGRGLLDRTRGSQGRRHDLSRSRRRVGDVCLRARFENATRRSETDLALAGIITKSSYAHLEDFAIADQVVDDLDAGGFYCQRQNSSSSSSSSGNPLSLRTALCFFGGGRRGGSSSSSFFFFFFFFSFSSSRGGNFNE